MKQAQIDQFWQDGFLLLKGAAESGVVKSIRQLAMHSLQVRIAPFELEADVQYPGSPPDQFAAGGQTIRRLREAWQRDERLSTWANHPHLVNVVSQLLGGDKLWLTQAHHNCIMTKHPSHSSETHWHRDCRYWSFTNCDLVSAWLALGDEHEDNGALSVVPGSHRLTLAPKQFEQKDFFRQDLPENQTVLAKAIQLQLSPGDVLLFHAQLLHAAGRNMSDEPKMALVFTYHNETTQPLAASRSAALPEVAMDLD